MTIYDKVKEVADEKNMSIAEVERNAGVANGTIGKWRTKKPLVETLGKVADALDTDVTNLVSF